MKITSIKGFADILPEEVGAWQRVEAAARRIFDAYHFAEIRIPIVEKTDLFSRSIGETTDIVEKEMYTFEDRDSRSNEATDATKLTLRPEGTAGVVRAYVEAEMYKVEPVRKLYYMGPMFRRERPQKGRMRQFHQIGAEALGRSDPFIDAEILLLLNDFFGAVGLTELTLQINSLGDSECRPQYREKLLAFLKRARNPCAPIAGAVSIAIPYARSTARSRAASRRPKMRRRFSIRCASIVASISPPCNGCCAKPMSSIRSIRAWCVGWITTAGRRSNGQPRN
jgi:histidyl-tRNA synthetase